MAFCSNCGSHIIDGANFCTKCGYAVSESTYKENVKRQQEFYGKIYKCPNCGEKLKSFVANCPACGLELRGARVTSAIREFSLKLEAIEARREYEKPVGIFAQTAAKERISKTDEQKISLIKSFSVPNTKEYILEFMILATSNMDATVYGSINDPTASAKAIANAWNAKIKQVYEKAKKSYGNNGDLQQIEELYINYIADLKKQKKKRIVKWVLLVGWILLMWIFIIVYLSISSSKENAAEETRLEAIVVDIETALEQKDYKLALRIAESMEYKRYDEERKRWWGIKKESLIDEIIGAAEENGVHLERSPTITDENDDNTNSGEFIDGFIEGVQSGLDAAKENIDEFNRIMEEGVNTKSKDTSES